MSVGESDGTKRHPSCPGCGKALRASIFRIPVRCPWCALALKHDFTAPGVFWILINLVGILLFVNMLPDLLFGLVLLGLWLCLLLAGLAWKSPLFLRLCEDTRCDLAGDRRFFGTGRSLWPTARRFFGKRWVRIAVAVYLVLWLMTATFGPRSVSAVASKRFRKDMIEQGFMIERFQRLDPVDLLYSGPPNGETPLYYISRGVSPCPFVVIVDYGYRAGWLYGAGYRELVLWAPGGTFPLRTMLWWRS